MNSENGLIPAERTVATAGQLDLGTIALKVLAISIGVALIAFTFTNSQFRDGENVLTGSFVFPFAAGFASVVFGTLIGTDLRTPALWFGVALVGQAASLQFIDAGRLIHFQNFRPFSELVERQPVALIFLLAQTVIAAYCILPHLRTVWTMLRENFAAWQIIVVVGFLFFAGAAVTPDIGTYARSLLMNAWVQIVSLATLLLLVRSVPRSALDSFKTKADRLLGPAEDTVDANVSVDRFVFAAAVWVVLLSAALSYFVYQGHPHVPDEAQYIFQARYMAAGQLTVEPPLVPEAFSMYMVPYKESRWYSIFSPGWPALLAVGTLFNAVWLVNPTLAGLCVILSYLFFQQMYNRRFARMAVLLLCCSPWFIFMAMSLMSHVMTLACTLGAAVLLNRALRVKTVLPALFAGGLIGVVSLIRPLDGMIVAVLLGLWAIVKTDTWRQRFFTGSALVIGTLATAAIILPYNKAVTGNAFLIPMDAYYEKYFWPKVMALGFGPERGMGWGLDAFPGHSPLEALINVSLNIFSTNIELFGSAFSGLAFVLATVVFRSIGKRDIWALAAVGGVVASYSLYWYHGGPDFGARYWFLCIVPLVALTVQGLNRILERPEPILADPRTELLVSALFIMSLVAYIPWRSADKYFNYLGVTSEIGVWGGQNRLGKSLILIRGDEHRDYQSAWIENPLDFNRDAPLYAWDKNAEIRRQLLQAYPDRNVWLLDGPTITNSRYLITKGPILARDLLLQMQRDTGLSDN